VICRDEQPARDRLKQVKLKNVKDHSAMRMTFDGGVLEMHCAYAQRTDGMFSDNRIPGLLTTSSEWADHTREREPYHGR
jgi:hypothetical protein